MANKRQVSQNQIIIEPLQEENAEELESILREHVRDIKTGEILLDEIDQIKSYMRGAKDTYGRIRIYLVAKDIKGKVLGCMAYSTPDPDMLKHFRTTPEESTELLSAFVSSSVFRGGGVGRKLFKTICNKARGGGKRQLIVHSGPRYISSWGFYDKMCDESCGFIAGKYGKGVDAKTWRKVL